MKRWFSLAFLIRSCLFGDLYVCMPFFNELDVLEVHLNELYDHVDFFVITESCESFTGIEKPFYFEINKSRFTPFLDKIKHVKSYARISTDNPWVREGAQRDALLEGLKDCKPDDLILLCDCDEIVSPKALQEGVELVDENTIALFNMDLYRYYLNRLDKEGWRAPVLSLYKTFKEVTPSEMRFVKWMEAFAKKTSNKYEVKLVTGGWHFTSFGGRNRVQEKMRMYSHANDPAVKDFLADFDRNLEKKLSGLEKIEIDSRFPSFVLNNMSLMAEWGFIEPDEPKT